MTRWARPGSSARNAASSARMCGHTSGGAPPDPSKVVCKAYKWRVNHLPSRDDDGIDARPLVGLKVLPEHFSNQSFRPVPHDRATQPARGDDAQPAVGAAVGEHQQRQITAVKPRPACEDLLELPPTPDPTFFRELL